ncbi:MAG: zeta toxin, partial [Bacteroidetes bacterium]
MDKITTKRLRIFAGPNGSGKSTLAKNLPLNKFSLGVFVNADEIEVEFKNRGFLSLFKYYKFKSTTEELREYIRGFGMSSKLLKQDDIELKFKIVENRVYYSQNFNSYISADIAGFVRNQLLKRGKSFSFETVFSHKSKLQFMKDARGLGYRVYLYFLATDDPDININRVGIRVAKKGHSVPKEKIIERYFKSLDLLYNAMRLSNRAYLFDSSGKYYELVAEITNG